MNNPGILESMSDVRKLFSSALILLFCAVGSALFPAPARGAMEEQFIFFPESELVATPAAVGLPFEDVRFTADDGTHLHGWYLEGESGSPLILFCHGNAGNISHRIENLRLFRRLGVSVFIFDYRGYGRSAGRPSEKGTYSDGRGALAWLAGRGWEPGRMIFFGRSLGASIAVQLALESPPAGLVLESPFPSIAAMGWHHNPVLYLLFGWWALNARYDNLDKIGRIELPLLVFQGERDAIVKEKMARRLFERANHPKTFHLIPGAGHNDTYEKGGDAYWQAWRRFLRQCGFYAP